jgi:hypothetical protein
MITILAGPNNTQLHAPRSQLCNASLRIAQEFKDEPNTTQLHWTNMPVEYCKVYIHWISTKRRFQDLNVHMLTGWAGDRVPRSKREKLIVVIPRLCQLWQYADYFQDGKLKSTIVDEIITCGGGYIPVETAHAFWTPEPSKLQLLIFDYLAERTTAQSFLDGSPFWPPGLMEKMLWWALANTSLYHRLEWNRGVRGQACRYHDHEEGTCMAEESRSQDENGDEKTT